MGDVTKLICASLCDSGLLWARLRARSSLCLFGTASTLPSFPSSDSSSFSFRKGLSLRVMMSGIASFTLSDHKSSTKTIQRRHTNNRGDISTWKTSRFQSEVRSCIADLMSLSCRVCWEARLMPSQRSMSLFVHSGGGTNWCTLAVAGPRRPRREAKSSLRTSGTFRFSLSSSPSEEESHVDLQKFIKSFSHRRMMSGGSELASFSVMVGALELEMMQGVNSERIMRSRWCFLGKKQHVQDCQ